MNISLTAARLEKKAVPLGPWEPASQPDEFPVPVGYADEEEEGDVDDLDEDEDEEEGDEEEGEDDDEEDGEEDE